MLFSREQEESTTEEEQLPQIFDELHDIHVAPGASLAKFHLKVKGESIPQYCQFLRSDIRLKCWTFPRCSSAAVPLG